MHCSVCKNPIQTGQTYCPSCGARLAPPPIAPSRPPTKTSTTPAMVIGVVLGLLVIVGILGIVAAIAIPNLVSATQRAKQKRTMSEMRSISAAVESCRRERGSYPEGRSIDELVTQLEPQFATSLPRRDAWERPFRYARWEEEGVQRYAIGSSGRDGEWERDDLSGYTDAPATSFDSDIILANGRFVQCPQMPSALAGSSQHAVTTAGPALKFGDLNFAFELPGKPWIQVDAKKINPDSVLAFMRAKPHILFFVIAEKAESELDPGLLSEIVKANLKSVASTCQVLEEGPYRVGDTDGTRMVSRATVDGSDLVYVHWVYAAGRHAYQLITVGSGSEEQLIRSEAEMLVRHFSLLSGAGNAGDQSVSQTITEMAKVVSALDRYARDAHHYPRSDPPSQLREELNPYLKEALPERDVWGNAYQYLAWSGEQPREYVFASAGPDGVYTHPDARLYASHPDDPCGDDVVVVNGKFIHVVSGGEDEHD